MKIKRKRYFIVPFLILAFLFILWYSVEPWTVTFIDDGPYYSTDYKGAVDELPLYSRLELNRLGRGAYVLESRLIDNEKPSVLLLREKKNNSLIWSQLPVKPDGELGPLTLVKGYRTWYGGWKIAINPTFQESGYLYLGPLGGFRFFNHSW
jgi:hypothetical protein